MRRVVITGVSIIISGVFLWLALRDVNLAEIGQEIRHADVGWLLVAFGCVSAGLWTRGVRWQGLTGFRINKTEAWHMVNITFLFNQLPLRLGEVARSLLTTRAGVPFIAAATGVLVERLIDTLLMVLLLATALSTLPNAPTEIATTARIFGVLAVVGFIMLLIFARRPHWAHKLLDIAERILPLLRRLPLRRLLEQVLQGLETLGDWRRLGHVMVWSLISWGFSTLTFYAMHRALNIDDINIALSIAFGMSLASFSIALPVSMAGIGPFQAAIRVTGEMVGMQALSAATLGVLLHGITILGYAIWGVISLLVLGVSLGDMLANREQTQNE